MTTDSITRELIEKYGPRCICCDALATRVVVKGTRPPKVSFTLGPLRMNVVIPQGITSDREIYNEVKRIMKDWDEEVSKSEELSKVIIHKPNYNLEALPVKEAPLCDLCGNPMLEYQDLEIAHIIREINLESEPSRHTRFERLLNDDTQ